MGSIREGGDGCCSGGFGGRDLLVGRALMMEDSVGRLLGLNEGGVVIRGNGVF